MDNNEYVIEGWKLLTRLIEVITVCVTAIVIADLFI
jgi:hypothetical protein